MSWRAISAPRALSSGLSSPSRTITPGGAVTRVRNTYRVLHAGSLVQEQVVERTLPLVRGSVLLAEAAAAGLTANRPDSELLVLRRS